MIAEIRSTGTQTALPGSTHPTGDRYRFDNNADISSIKWSELKALVSKVAAAAIAAHYYPEEGSRHDYVHALTGALLHAKWPDGEVRAFMKAVRDAASSTDEEIKDRDGTIEHTIKSYHANKHVQGLPTLANFMPELSVQNLRRYLSIEEFIPDNDETPPDTIAAEPVGTIDPRHLRVPGLVGEIMKWAGRRSIIKQPLFDLAIGLMGTALATRNKYKIAGLDTPLQPYMLCVAGTAGGKNQIREALRTLAPKLGLNKSCFTGSQSYHAMLDLLAQPPHVALWLWDECARYLKASARSVSSQENAILSHVISLYGTAICGCFGMPARKNPIPDIDHPFFLVMGMTQPELLLEAITSTDFQTGFVNRFLLFDAGENASRKNEQRYTGFPSAIEGAFKKFDDIKLPEGEFIEVDYVDNEAFATLDDFQTYQVDMAARRDRGADLWGRAHQNALICAGLVAVGVNPIKPVITREIALWAVELVRWSVERWLVRIDQSAARNYTEAQSKDVERLIFQTRRWKHEAKDEKDRQLMEKGLCPLRWLAWRCRYIRQRDFKEIVSALIQIGLIGASVSEGRDIFWPKQRANA
jgi:hypothetical protein